MRKTYEYVNELSYAAAREKVCGNCGGYRDCEEDFDYCMDFLAALTQEEYQTHIIDRAFDRR